MHLLSFLKDSGCSLTLIYIYTWENNIIKCLLKEHLIFTDHVSSRQSWKCATNFLDWWCILDNETLLIWVKKWKILIFFNSECYEWKFRESIKKNPTNYLALPLIECIIVMKWRKLNKFTHCFLLMNVDQKWTKSYANN